MTSLRLARIPFEHIEAELAAFPLSSEASFGFASTSLNPRASSDGEALWRAAERAILRTPSIPLDEVISVRDMVWFDSSTLNQARTLEERIKEEVPLWQYLKRLSARYLDQNGDPKAEGLGPPSSVGPEIGRLRWSWLCQALPPDLIRTARGIEQPDQDPFVLDNDVKSKLDQGFAETHLHLGAALDFSLAWAALMRALANKKSNHSDFESPGACFENGQMLGFWLLHAAIIRVILADWVFHGPIRTSSVKDLLTFAANRPGRRLDLIERQQLWTLVEEFRLGRFVDASESSESSLRSRFRFTRRFAQNRALYGRIVGPAILLRNPWEDYQVARRPEYGVLATDPIAEIVGWNPQLKNSPETLFISESLEYMKRAQDQTHFARLFWQMIRIRCLLYRHVVQRPLTPGLQWFVRFFSRIKPLRTNLSEAVLMSAAANLSGEGDGLESLEVRLGTEENESACLQKLRNLERIALPETQIRNRFFSNSPNSSDEANRHARFEVGTLFHFSRKRGGGWEYGKPNAFGIDHSYPRKLGTRASIRDAGNPTGFRFAHFYKEQKRHAQALVNLLQMYPSCLSTFRGVDLCTDEAGVPIWVMAPLVRWVHDAFEKAASQLDRRGLLSSSLRATPFRTSVHAGEDFVHLLTGLRRLDEAVEHLQLRKDDRIGHALALGEDTSKWCERTGRIVQPTEERFLDLLWEWSYRNKHRMSFSPSRKKYLRLEILRLATFIFGDEYSLQVLVAFVEMLHSEKALRSVGFPDHTLSGAPRRPVNSKRASNERSNYLLATYLRDEAIWRRGKVPLEIDLTSVPHEKGALRSLQNSLRHNIRRKRIRIEVNPSSNLLVGNLGNYVEHPIWRLKSSSAWSRFFRRNVLVCVGSDDPLTFATRLRHEYQLLYDAMVLMKQPKKRALEWINAVRKTGMESRFTLARSTTDLSQGLKTPNLFKSERPESPP
ncbi:MAG TPA: hypothetical protein VJR02_14050 [Pyrinomonadaceae bacterium]|nr:hypothetical protein [Pyrinomonadaceae bacterium]